MNDIGNRAFWNRTLAMMAVMFFCMWSVGLDSYHRNSKILHMHWWHIAKIDAIGSFFSTNTLPVSSYIPKNFSLDFGGDTIYIFRREAMPLTAGKRAVTYHVTDSIWELQHLLCTLLVVVICFLIAWLVLALAAQQRPRFMHIKQRIRSQMTRTQRKAFALVAIAMIAGSSWGIGYWWKKGSDRATCSLHLLNYNSAIWSCGIDPNALFSWRDVKATEEMVWKHFKLKAPKCPSGGHCSLVFGRGFEGRWQPRAVCSKENELGHIANDIKNDEVVRDESGLFPQR